MLCGDSSGIVSAHFRDGADWRLLGSFNRNGTVAVSIKMSHSQRDVSIVYEDGCVMMTTPSLECTWERQLKVPLGFTEWSPDDNRILIGHARRAGMVAVYDRTGSFNRRVPLPCIDGCESELVGISWVHPTYPYSRGLVIAFANGRAQMMTSENDESPVLIDCGISISAASWSPSGSVCALAGCSSILFFTATGHHVKTISTQSAGTESIQGLAWHSSGKTMGILLGDSKLLIVAVRQASGKCWYANTCCSDSVTGVTVSTEGAPPIQMRLPRILCIKGRGQFSHCGCLSREGESFTIRIINAIGGIVKARTITDLHITMLDVCGPIVLIGSGDSRILTWNWETDVEYIVPVPDSGDVTAIDRIVDLSASPSLLSVARESGVVHMYRYLDGRHGVPVLWKSLIPVQSVPYRIELNCDGTILAIIDIDGHLHMLSVSEETPKVTKRMDCWDMVWSTDSPDLLACMDKDKIYVVRADGRSDEPIGADGNILIGFDQLEIVTMDTDRRLRRTPSKPLRDCMDVVYTVGNLRDACLYASAHPHPRLWMLIAEGALVRPTSTMDLAVAEKAFCEAGCFQGVQLIKRLRQLDPNNERMTLEVLMWFGRIIECREALSHRADLLRELERVTGAGGLVNTSDQSDSPPDCGGLLEQLIMRNDYAGIIALSKEIPNEDKVLLDIARVLELSGLTEEADVAYSRCCKSGTRVGTGGE